MRISELIEELQKHNPELYVYTAFEESSDQAYEFTTVEGENEAGSDGDPVVVLWFKDSSVDLKMT